MREDPAYRLNQKDGGNGTGRKYLLTALLLDFTQLDP
jgi:hypothetical protein